MLSGRNVDGSSSLSLCFPPSASIRHPPPQFCLPFLLKSDTIIHLRVARMWNLACNPSLQILKTDQTILWELMLSGNAPGSILTSFDIAMWVSADIKIASWGVTCVKANYVWQLFCSRTRRMRLDLSGQDLWKSSLIRYQASDYLWKCETH
jgi:hypothetical protein